MFKIGELGEYIPQNVEENDFLNSKLESDTYGIYYSVKFEGDAETYLMQAKKAPVEGQAEWGMIEMSKSGKSKRFKRVKKEGAVISVGDKAYLKDVTDLPARFIQALLPYYDVQSLLKNPEQYGNLIKLAGSLADDAKSMIDGLRNSTSTSGTPDGSPPSTQESKVPRGEAADTDMLNEVFG